MGTGEQPAHAGPRILNLRALVSVLAGVGFGAMLLSGLVLFFAPSGRITRLDEWSFAGLLRHDWLAIHIGFALLFVAAGAVHLALNWRAMRHYLAARRPEGFRIGMESILAILLCGLLAVAAIERWPPFDSILGLHKSIKSGDTKGGASDPSRRGRQPWAR